MTLEATMLVVDSSEYAQNGDYTPSRFDAQRDAVHMLFQAKTNANPESAVALMTMGGKGPDVLVTLTDDFGKMLAALHETKIHGTAHLTTALQVGQLALKHRQNKNQRQRIIVFVCSPITEDEATLVKLAKKMKKNSVSVDFINFGEEGENTAKLTAFVQAINSSENSHLVTIPPGPHLLSDVLATSEIVGGTGSMHAGGGGGGGEEFEFGIDPSTDPELALALRMSLEEEQARQRG
ncbi:26S proteasome regulatory subunit S5A [Taphrina deformans PYCC 5710]|uniref:26S proteasome regulatory subunit S5A n=1 Tax=Taphrina deformans (strain PYCC 5710 / ATCC 11124 / CBS 356.35 / IMI 108563 / JCM 9778 / NBRC 8474) TaxID=1097556 RepID=R4XJC0_TAPDE|nr:26S proteasome regulatory subunit S5A [Taphrina deformans PYCC 5710]|eukprot:CCG83455.1 26S proteasome regulatory subunit S5A [Taphrina deformans PYCC 5710]